MADRSRRPEPLRLLVIVVAIDVVVAGVLRFDRAQQFIDGRRDWQSWVGLGAAAYLVLVLVALVLAVRETTRMRADVASAESALARHAETTSDWLWETTPELVLTYSSRQVLHVLGYQPRDVIGRDAHEFMTLPTAKVSRDALLSGTTLEGWRDLHSDWLHSDGSIVTLRHSGAPIRDAHGKVLGYRGSCTVVGPATADAHRRESLRVGVQDVLDRGELPMALQPIIEVSTGQLTGVEALARFPDGRPPNVWFDDAGEVGLRVELEMLAVRCAIARLPELPTHVTLSINACPEVVADPRFSHLLLEAGIPLSRLVIEVTEHVKIARYDDLVVALNRLRLAGARVAVDDAGAGYASLTHVLRLRPDVIKLDRSLVTEVQHDRARRTLVTALVLLGLDIGATVTAEGVESAEELETVAELGVDHAQGYLIGRPSTDVGGWARPPVTRVG